MRPSGWLPRVIAAFVLVTLWGCPPPEEGPEERPETIPAAGWEEEPVTREARAQMIDSEGQEVGIVTLAPEGDELVRIRGHLHLPSVPPTLKGFHVHKVGECEPPDFESAGEHFDPHGRPHGGPEDPAEERHAGDLGNVEMGADGSVSIDLVDAVIGLGEGPTNVVGRSLVLHDGEDDLTSQPAGDAGSRVSCGVIETG